MIRKSNIAGKRRAKVIRFQLVTILIAVVLTGILAASSIAADQSDPKRPFISGEMPVHPGFPAQFDGHGIIDAIFRKAVVVDDAKWAFAPQVSFKAPSAAWASRRSFSKGDYVGFLLDSKGLVKSLWLIQKNK